MKAFTKTLYILLTIIFGISVTSCDDYLGILPKGAKIPTTLADFEALLRDESWCHKVDVTQANLLLNDRFITSFYQSYYPYWAANYNWDESADRITLNKSDETSYNYSYSSISTCNLIIENCPTATECTDKERNQLTAQAKVIKAMNYFNLINLYADTYEASNAASKPGVPYITSASISAPYQQLTVKEIYDHMLTDVNDAVQYLPDTSATALHPNKGTAYAFLARCYLQMSDYTNALTFAEKALAVNKQLFDWNAFYNLNKLKIENPSSYNTSTSPMNYSFVENYDFRHGGTTYSSRENSVTTERAARFEQGDAQFASRWKKITVGSDTYYKSILLGYYNYGGITTTEVYLIKAECMARAGKVQEALDLVNAVRIKRILPAYYVPATAGNATDALKLIIKTKSNALVMTLMPFADARRWNKETAFQQTFSKVVNGQTVTLLPGSHLWTMPFPKSAIENHGNGTLTQNVSK